MKKLIAAVYDKLCRGNWDTRFGRILCEKLGHDKVIWYSFGLDPDMRCSRCFQDLAMWARFHRAFRGK